MYIVLRFKINKTFRKPKGIIEGRHKFFSYTYSSLFENLDRDRNTCTCTCKCTVYVNKMSPYSTVIIQVVSLSHYSSSTVVLTVIVYLSIEHHSSETVITLLY